MTPDGPADPDADLVERAKRGDGAAFDALVARHQEKVYGLAVRMGATSYAEDVLQETFLKVLQRLPGFRGSSKFSTWLHAIATNEILMRHRAGRAHPVASLESYLPGFDEAGRLARRDLDYARAARADELVERAELAEKLQDAVQRLPEIYRLPVVLHDLQGLPGREAAEILEVEPATFRTRLHRARLMLRGYLDSLVRGEV